jgi:GNAT superfamily N-acetyltransferase
VAEWFIERLGRAHDRKGFSCGNGPLDDFLRSLAGQYEKRNIGRTYVATRPGEARVLGYYTLSSGAVPIENLPEPSARKLPRHPVPTILLGRLAVDREVHGQGLGEALLVDALGRALDFSETLGVHAVEVVAIDERARAFYERYGFLTLIDDPLHLYLPIASIRNADSS